MILPVFGASHGIGSWFGWFGWLSIGGPEDAGLALIFRLKIAISTWQPGNARIPSFPFLSLFSQILFPWQEKECSRYNPAFLIGSPCSFLLRG